MSEAKIPYKIYLSEEEMPRAWYNVRADMKVKPAPLLNPATGKPMGFEDLRGVFCDELITPGAGRRRRAEIPIPQDIRDFYKMYRPSPLVRAYCLEEKLGHPGEDLLQVRGQQHLRLAQAELRRRPGLLRQEPGPQAASPRRRAPASGAPPSSMACAYLGLDCQVYMVKCSYEQKPFRREVMRTYGASVTPSPSMTTEVGRKILAEHPGTTGSSGLRDLRGGGGRHHARRATATCWAACSTRCCCTSR